jgi:hypothetical protein
VSWLATKYAWNCRHAAVKGGVRVVLLALAYQVKAGRITTKPTSMGRLRWLTFLSEEQIRRIINQLEGLGLVRRLNRGKNAVYGLPLMAGPLFAVDPDEPMRMADFVLEPAKKKPGKMTGNRPVENTPAMTGFSGPMTGFSARRAGGVPSSDRTGTESTATADEQAAADFLTWFEAQYRLTRGHAHDMPRPMALGIVIEMLARRTPARLREMAVLMFSAERDAFIVGSDYSLRVLRHKANYLDDIAERNERASERREATR